MRTGRKLDLRCVHNNFTPYPYLCVFIRLISIIMHRLPWKKVPIDDILSAIKAVRGESLVSAES